MSNARIFLVDSQRFSKPQVVFLPLAPSQYNSFISGSVSDGTAGVHSKEKTELSCRAQLTLTVDIANQAVLGVRPLFPVTLTVMYLFLCDDVGLKVVLVCPVMAVHLLGTV